MDKITISQIYAISSLLKKRLNNVPEVDVLNLAIDIADVIDNANKTEAPAKA